MELVQKYIELTEEQINQLKKFQVLFLDWNSKINLISRKNEEAFLEQHVLHSLLLGRFLPQEARLRILDIGTGGGLPGIPLAILFPQHTFHMVDSIGKKVKAVANMIEELGLTNATAEHKRVEELKMQFDLAVTRAVAKSEKLWNWTLGKIAQKHGVLALKGGDLSEELSELLEAFPKVKFKEILLYPYCNLPFFETKKVVHLFKK